VTDHETQCFNLFLQLCYVYSVKFRGYHCYEPARLLCPFLENFAYVHNQFADGCLLKVRQDLLANLVDLCFECLW
jgi:hypothetical protein